VIIGVSQTFQFKRRNSRLGELDSVILCLLIIMCVTYGILDVYALLILCNSAFLEISRNRLAGDKPPPGDSCNFMCSGFLEEEPPGGTLLAARRRKAS